MRGNYTLGLLDLVRNINNPDPRSDMAIQIVAFADMYPNHAIVLKECGIVFGNRNVRLIHAGLQYRLGRGDVGVIEAPTDQMNRMFVGDRTDIIAVNIPERGGRINGHRPELMDFLEREDRDSQRLDDPENGKTALRLMAGDIVVPTGIDHQSADIPARGPDGIGKLEELIPKALIQFYNDCLFHMYFAIVLVHVRKLLGNSEPAVQHVISPHRVKRPGIAGGQFRQLCCHWGVVQHAVVALFSLGRRDIADGLAQSAVVEPVYPFERGIFNGFK